MWSCPNLIDIEVYVLHGSHLDDWRGPLQGSCIDQLASANSFAQLQQFTFNLTG